jgi:hypothetical protein
MGLDLFNMTHVIEGTQKRRKKHELKMDKVGEVRLYGKEVADADTARTAPFFFQSNEQQTPVL